MARLLMKNASHIVTCDPSDTVYTDSNLLMEDGVITYIGPEEQQAEEVIDAAGCIVYPGLINTHHHLYQTTTTFSRRGRRRGCWTHSSPPRRIWASGCTPPGAAWT